MILLLVALQIVASQNCSPCIVAMTSFNIWATNDKNKARISSFLDTLCQEDWVPEDCSDLLPYLVPEIKDALLLGYFSPNRFCSLLGACSSPNYTAENFTKWEEEVNKGSQTYFTPTSGQMRYMFAQITDIHYDEKYIEGSASKCTARPCCRGSFSPESSAGSFGDYNCDIPFETVSLAVDSLYDKGLDFIIWTGDTAAHDSTLKKEEKIASVKKVTDLLWQKFNKIVPVYPIFGRYDSFLTGQYNFSNNNYLAAATAAFWKPWIGSQAAGSLARNGRYSLMHRDTNLRIVVVNTLACDYLNLWLLENVTDPGENIQFLYDELRYAEDNQMFVYIIGHIPPGSESCLGVWSKHYQVLARRFANTIRGQFFGHEHLDGLKLGLDDSGKAVSIQFVSPSLGSFGYINPSFRVYEANFDTKSVLNYKQYRLDLTDSSKGFVLSYDFLGYYIVEDMNPPTLLSLANRMKNDELISVKFLRNKFTGSVRTPADCDQGCRNDLVCDLLNDNPDESRQCKGLDLSPSQYILARLYGKWVYMS